jgi:signal transduction histidine kinase
VSAPLSRLHGWSLWGWRSQLSILLPTLFAGGLVVALALQSVRAARTQRVVVDRALRDYAACAAWQYTRRASDYLRLVLTAAATSDDEGGAPFESPRSCDAKHTRRLPACVFPLHADGSATCTARGGRIRVVRNESPVATPLLQEALDRAAVQSRASGFRIGLVPQATGGAPLVAYWLLPSHGAAVDPCTAVVLGPDALVPVFQHVLAFAPLLPPSLVGQMPNDSIVSVRVAGTGGSTIAALGQATPGTGAAMTANDVLGPDLGDLRVEVTLHPEATRRLVAGTLPGTNPTALAAMLAVTLVLFAVALYQLRRGQQMNRLRSDFVAGVSHELKTPLAQISLFADTLASPRERSADERRQYLGIISRESRRLGQLVDSILHFAGMMRSGEHSAVEPAYLGEEIRAAVASFEPIAASRAMTIQTRVAEEVEAPLDRDAFRQLMLNVLDNALKFGPEGQQVVVSVWRSGSYARIWIDDQGPGIPPRVREAVFEPFVRGERAGSAGGSGIGLAVVRDVVRRHGGTVRILESPSGGVRVDVELPHARAAVESGTTTSLR